MVLARKTPKCMNRAPSRNLHPREAAEQILRFFVQLKRCLTIAKRNVLLFKPVHLKDVFATCAFEILQKIFPQLSSYRTPTDLTVSFPSLQVAVVSVVLSRCCASCQFVCFSKSRPRGKPCFAFFPAESQITYRISQIKYHGLHIQKSHTSHLVSKNQKRGPWKPGWLWHTLPRHTRENTCSSLWLKVNSCTFLSHSSTSSSFRTKVH